MKCERTTCPFMKDNECTDPLYLARDERFTCIHATDYTYIDVDYELEKIFNKLRR